MHKRLIILLIIIISCINFNAKANVIDSLKLELQTLDNNNNNQQAKILNKIAEEYLQIDADISIEYAQKAIDISEKNGDKLTQARALRILGTAYLTLGYNKLALKNYQTSLKLCNEINNKKEKAESLNKIGIVYKRTSNYDLALLTFNECLKMQMELKNTKEVGSLYLNIGAVYSMKQQHDTALYYTKKAMDTYDFSKGNDQSLFALYNNNMGYAYEEFYKLDSALMYYKIAINIAEDIDEYAYMASYYINIAYAYLKLENYKLSKEYFQKGIEIAKKNKLKSVQSEAYWGLYELNLKVENYKDATEYLENYIMLNDSVQIISNNVEIEELRLIYDIEEKEKEIQLLERDKQITLIKQYVLIATIIIIIIVGLLIISRLKSDAEKRKLKSKVLNDEIKYKNNQLTDFALHIIQRNEFLKNIDTQLKKLKRNANQEILSDIRDIESIIKRSINQINERKEFNHKVELANQIFYRDLELLYPKLTKNEKKVAALLRLRLSSKEISTLLNVNAKSIDNYRYHIRKKLHLTRDEDLNDFLNSIS